MALSPGPRLPVPYQAGPAAQLLLRARARPRCLLCNQKRSCCLDISIFISFIDFIFMSFREHFLWLLTSFCCPCPLARLEEKERRVRKGVRGSVPCAPFSGLMHPVFSLIPLPPGPSQRHPAAPRSRLCRRTPLAQILPALPRRAPRHVGAGPAPERRLSPVRNSRGKPPSPRLSPRIWGRHGYLPCPGEEAQLPRGYQSPSPCSALVTRDREGLPSGPAFGDTSVSGTELARRNALPTAARLADSFPPLSGRGGESPVAAIRQGSVCAAGRTGAELPRAWLRVISDPELGRIASPPTYVHVLTPEPVM